MNNKGKFFVIDGIDGSGKGTQTKIIIEKLQQEGYNVLETDFPQYGHKSAALVEEYLNGKFGNFDEVTAYQASVFYACDRFAASPKMRKHLSEGGIIISNRYVSSSQIHQASKITDPDELDKFITWLDDLEFNLFNIPKPDRVFFLNMPFEVSQKLCKKKEKRAYIENDTNLDIHEQSSEHLELAHKRATDLKNRFDYWREVKCTDNKDQLRTIEDINLEIYELLKKEIDGEFPVFER